MRFSEKKLYSQKVITELESLTNRDLLVYYDSLKENSNEVSLLDETFHLKNRVVFHLSEPVVKLPIPNWVIISGETHNSELSSIFVFESEMNDFINKFKNGLHTTNQNKCRCCDTSDVLYEVTGTSRHTIFNFPVKFRYVFCYYHLSVFMKNDYLFSSIDTISFI